MPNEVQCKQEDKDSYTSTLILSPLERGFSSTFGNALRRTLLSSIQGFAVIAVRITLFNDDGGQTFVTNEHDQIADIVEDTNEILDRIASLKFYQEDVLDSDYILTGDFNGAGVCKADIFENGPLKILNSDKELFVASSKVSLSFELQVEYGRGYVPAETNEKRIDEVGTICIDAIFSPVTQVSFTTENIRIGHRSDYEQLAITVSTDGTVKPSETLGEAAKIIKDYLQFFIDFDEKLVLSPEDSQEKEQLEEDKVLDLSINELELSSRAYNCLQAENVKTLRELVQYTPTRLSNFPNFGAKSLDEIKLKLGELGLSLKSTEIEVD